MLKFGLIGRNISYSFSRNYFMEKFRNGGISANYENFDLKDISEFPLILQNNPDLRGLNVTIPYKEQIIPYLNTLDPAAREIGAVNTIRIEKNSRLTGFNTDYFGFSNAIRPYLLPHHQKALVLGTGGASKAVTYALLQMGIEISTVSRNPEKGNLTYKDIDQDVLAQHTVIINCTPLGTFPNTADYPPVPVEKLGEQHLIFDLIYNPSMTRLMELAQSRGATVLNGYKMLELQADRAWMIWNS